MLQNSTEDSSQQSTDNYSGETVLRTDVGEFDWYDYHGELELEISEPSERKCEECISPGDYLPYGPRLFWESTETFWRMKDIGEGRRILVLGVVGSFTPYCWNRHLFRVLAKARYYEERDVDFICCVSTNDAYTQYAWGEHLGCSDILFMLSDPTKKFTVGVGMDMVVPWLDDTVRSKRYVLYAEDMEVTKLIVAPDDGPNIDWQCEHLKEEQKESEEDEDSESYSWF